MCHNCIQLKGITHVIFVLDYNTLTQPNVIHPLNGLNGSCYATHIITGHVKKNPTKLLIASCSAELKFIIFYLDVI